MNNLNKMKNKNNKNQNIVEYNSLEVAWHILFQNHKIIKIVIRIQK